MSTQVFSVQHVRCSPPGPSCNYVMFYVLQDLRAQRSCGWRLSFQLNTHTADQRQHVFYMTCGMGTMRVHVKRVHAYGLHVPRRRDGSFNPRQGQVFVWDGGRHMILPQLARLFKYQPAGNALRCVFTDNCPSAYRSRCELVRT